MKTGLVRLYYNVLQYLFCGAKSCVYPEDMEFVPAEIRTLC